MTTNNMGLTTPLRDSPSFIQNNKALAFHAHRQIHRQLQLNPFKDAVIAY